MAAFLGKIAPGYKYLFEDLANPVTSKYFLIDNTILFPTLIIVYLLFCTKIGPWYMKNRKPYDLNNVIKIYNFIQVIISAVLVQQIGQRIFFHDYNFKCEVSTLESPYFHWEARLSYMYFLAKITELLDTVFFVLRKSYRQITPLHLIHHSIMPFGCWLFIRWYPGGNAAIMGFLNSSVHVVMYSYYLLASLGDQYKKILWWKKYVTIMQLVQFVIVAVHSFNSLFYDCGYLNALKLLFGLQAVFFFKMFWNFYSKTYLNKRTEKSIKSNSNGIHKKEENKSQ